MLSEWISINLKGKIVEYLYRLAFSAFLLGQIGQCYSSESINLILLPDAYNCHHAGFEISMNEKSTLGFLGVPGCNSDRPTYGEIDDDVNNDFSRLLVPWRYSPHRAFTTGYFFQAIAGLEKSEFTSTLGSTADVTFANFGGYAGYQWFWRNGFNISVMGGAVYLQELSSSTTLAPGEGNDVREFLDKNTNSNIHGGYGIIFGWLF